MPERRVQFPGEKYERRLNGVKFGIVEGTSKDGVPQGMSPITLNVGSSTVDGLMAGSSLIAKDTPRIDVADIKISFDSGNSMRGDMLRLGYMLCTVILSEGGQPETLFPIYLTKQNFEKLKSSI